MIAICDIVQSSIKRLLQIFCFFGLLIVYLTDKRYNKNKLFKDLKLYCTFCFVTYTKHHNKYHLKKKKTDLKNLPELQVDAREVDAKKLKMSKKYICQ